ncbi:MAG TPA: peptide deformylase [Terriglobia bacterium]|nr:peptide deformylase [Terriglobia bacterium]
MKLAFIPPSDPILTKIAEPVTEEDLSCGRLTELIESMIMFAKGEQDEQNRMILVGLAAPQIGISKRIILVDLAPTETEFKVGDLRVFVNPQITWSSEETSEWYEGCFSTDRVRGIVDRATRLRVRYLDTDAQVQEHEFHGYTARICQHEIDHLDGRDFVSRIADDDKLHWVEYDRRVQYWENWRNWPVKCPREKYYQIKRAKPPAVNAINISSAE